ncbi:MAG: zinc ribbon domain-containing protein [Candidatus Thorarchaeota archaeon]|nr:zinc ribbon domain-containing protein [Candidatus Thorarchaeota archaeon]
MSSRPAFLTVSYSGGSLDTLGHEKKMVSEKDVKFDGEDGSIELTDIRIVWYKKPSKMGGLKKFGAVAGALAAAAAVDAIGDSVGGFAGRAISRTGRSMGYMAVGAAISSWTMDSYYNKDKNGNTESLALPLVAIGQAAQSGDKLVIELKSGGNMQFHFKQKKVIPSIIANITSAQSKGKCPFCGTSAGNANKCPNCGAALEGGGEGPSGSQESVTISMSGGGKFCTNCGNPAPEDARFCGKCGNPL